MEALDLYGGREAVLKRCREQVLDVINQQPSSYVKHSLQLILDLDDVSPLLDNLESLPEKVVLKLYKLYGSPKFLERVLGNINFTKEGPNSRASWEAEMKKFSSEGSSCGPLTFEQYILSRVLEEFN